jgi:hypothetical protein
MYNQKPNILSQWAKIPLLSLYISFLIVQLFFNFDIANPLDPGTFHPSYASVTTGYRYPGIGKRDNAENKKPTVRLNKRFKPQVILVQHSIILISPIRYTDPKSFVTYPGFFIPAPFLRSPFFRGPPVVA